MRTIPNEQPLRRRPAKGLFVAGDEQPPEHHVERYHQLTGAILSIHFVFCCFRSHALC